MYACGSRPFILALSISVIARARVSAPVSEPANNQFFLPRHMGLTARSAALLSMAARPSSIKRLKACQRPKGVTKGLRQVSLGRDTVICFSAQLCRASSLGRLNSWRTARRISAGLPAISRSMS